MSSLYFREHNSVDPLTNYNEGSGFFFKSLELEKESAEEQVQTEQEVGANVPGSVSRTLPVPQND